MVSAPIPTPRRYYNVEQACAHIGCSKEWLYVRLREGNGPPLIRKAGRVFFSIAALDEWMLRDQLGPGDFEADGNG